MLCPLHLSCRAVSAQLKVVFPMISVLFMSSPGMTKVRGEAVVAELSIPLAAATCSSLLFNEDEPSKQLKQCRKLLQTACTVLEKRTYR